MSHSIATPIPYAPPGQPNRKIGTAIVGDRVLGWKRDMQDNKLRYVVLLYKGTDTEKYLDAIELRGRYEPSGAGGAIRMTYESELVRALEEIQERFVTPFPVKLGVPQKSPVELEF